MIFLVKDKYYNILLLGFLIIWLPLITEPFMTYFFLNGEGVLKKIIPFYPIFFLPLFSQKTDNRFFISNYIEILLGIGLLIFSTFKGYQSLICITGFWLGLSLLKGFGRKIFFPGKLLLFLVPPFNFKYSLLFGFPLRLFLSEISGYILKALDPLVSVHGNIIIFFGKEYLVDPACEGLKMITALVILILFLYKENFSKNKRPFQFIVLFVFQSVLAFLLCLLANLFRIIFLITVNIPSESVNHQFIGIILFISIVIFPTFIFFNFLHSNRPREKKNFNFNSKFPFMAFLVIALILVIQRNIPFEESKSIHKWPGYTGKYIEIDKSGNSIKIFSNKTSKLIIKGNNDPFRVAHHPRQCWAGAGFEILKESRISFGSNGSIRHVFLKKEKRKYQLLWWYEPIGTKDIPVTDLELEWRKNFFLKNLRYFQVNLIIANNMDPREEFLRLFDKLD